MSAIIANTTKNLFHPSSYAFQTPVIQPANSSGLFEDYVDVILVFLPKYEKEFLQNTAVLRNQQGDIELYELLKSLREKGFPIAKNVISYYSASNDMYVYCGNDPLYPGAFIPADEITQSEDGKQITIRVRQALLNHSASAEPSMAYENVKVEGNVTFDADQSGMKQKRTKERKIGEILDKVLQWRRLYTGVTDLTTGQTMKMPLEEAAKRVGISKKSLDDYLLQIRFGKKYGFNFNDHFNARVGVLRTFVRTHKSKKGNKDVKIEEDEFYNEEEETRKTLPMDKRSKRI